MVERWRQAVAAAWTFEEVAVACQASERRALVGRLWVWPGGDNGGGESMMADGAPWAAMEVCEPSERGDALRSAWGGVF